MLDLETKKQYIGRLVSSIVLDANEAIDELNIRGGFEWYFHYGYPEVVEFAKQQADSVEKYGKEIQSLLKHKSGVLDNFISLITSYADTSAEYAYYDKILSLYFSTIGDIKQQICDFKVKSSSLHESIISIKETKNKIFDEFDFDDIRKQIVNELNGVCEDVYTKNQLKKLILADENVSNFFTFLDEQINIINGQIDEIKTELNKAYSFKNNMFKELGPYKEKRKQTYNALYGYKYKIKDFINKLNEEDFEMIKDSVSYIFDTSNLKDSEIISTFMQQISSFTSEAIGSYKNYVRKIR